MDTRAVILNAQTDVNKKLNSGQTQMPMKTMKSVFKIDIAVLNHQPQLWPPIQGRFIFNFSDNFKYSEQESYVAKTIERFELTKKNAIAQKVMY